MSMHLISSKQFVFVKPKAIMMPAQDSIFDVSMHRTVSLPPKLIRTPKLWDKDPKRTQNAKKVLIKDQVLKIRTLLEAVLVHFPFIQYLIFDIQYSNNRAPEGMAGYLCRSDYLWVDFNLSRNSFSKICLLHLYPVQENGSDKLISLNYGRASLLNQFSACQAYFCTYSGTV